MFYYPSVQEGIAWLTASDDDWAEYAVAMYEAAVKRGEDGPPEDNAS